MNQIKGIARLLQELGFIKELPAMELLASAPDGPIQYLSRLEAFDEVQALKAIANYLKIKFIDLGGEYKVKPDELQALVNELGSDTCWAKRIVPISKSPSELLVAFSNPLDHDTRKFIEFVVQRPVTVALAEERKIIQHLRGCLPALRLDLKDIEELDDDSTIEFIGLGERDLCVESEAADTPPVIKLCNRIFSQAIASDASDIHIEPTQHEVEVRFRVDGVMRNVLEFPKKLQPLVTTRLKLLAGMDISERRRPQDGRLRIRPAGELVDVRVSSVPAAYGEKLVLRLLRTQADILSISSLGMPHDTETKIRASLDHMGKLILVTGPTGSGKTTTLYTFLLYLQDGTCNTVTVEDPIEYRIKGVNQIQINSAVDVSFASTLRSILRQDPDVIMIGEIRDSETALIALQAAQTGHFVLSTLHTNDALSAVARLIDLGVDRHVVSSTLGGVLAQRLVRALCPSCLVSAEASYLLKYAPVIEGCRLDAASLKQANGCEQCKFTGYRGRIGVFSYLDINTEVAELIYKQAPSSEILSAAKRHGFVDLSGAAIDLVRRGITTFEEVHSLVSVHEVSQVESMRSALPLYGADAKKGSVHPNKLQKAKILIVEDDEDVRSTLRLLFETEMFEVIEAKNGEDGLRKVYDHNPALVLCDLMMPIMDGREFLLRMRKHKETRAIPVLILTAIDSEEKEIELLDVGARDFISKASSPGIMLSRVRRVIEETA